MAIMNTLQKIRAIGLNQTVKCDLMIENNFSLILDTFLTFDVLFWTLIAIINGII